MEEELFNEAMAEFDRQIELLPEASRPALRALAEGTRKRATEIKDAVEAGKAAAQELVQTMRKLADANTKLMEKAGDLSLFAKYAMFTAEARARELRGEGLDHD